MTYIIRCLQYDIIASECVVVNISLHVSNNFSTYLQSPCTTSIGDIIIIFIRRHFLSCKPTNLVREINFVDIELFDNMMMYNFTNLLGK